MELADARLVSQLVASYENTKRATRRARGPHMTSTLPPEVTPYQAPAHKSRRCQCGKCPLCRENARWDRIFLEKFADPSYYSGPTIRYVSPLHTA